jgi:hypothetical protein
MRRLLLGLALSVVLPVGAAAQVCVGQPALSATNMGSVGMGASFFDEGKTVGLDATVGSSLFGFGSFHYTDFDGSNLSLSTVGAGVGYDIEEAEGVSICPLVGLSYGFGLEMPDIVGDELVQVDHKYVRVSPGLAIGLATELSSNFTVAPFARGHLVYTRVTRDAGDFGDTTTDETSGALSLGVGLVLNDRLSFVPTLFVPVGNRGVGQDTAFGITLAVGLGDW